MTSFLKPLPYEGSSSSIINMNINENNNSISKINRIAKKARASIKIVSLADSINNNKKNEYNNTGQLKECWSMLGGLQAAC
jgi:hypothetical protein